MAFWFLLLLGLFTYLIVQRSVAGITRTPVWILWLVLMTPALIWSGWAIVYGPDQPLPTVLAIGPFVICPVIYWLLIQWGRKELNSSSQSTTNQDSEVKTPQEVKSATPVRPIEPTEEAQLRSCFPWSIFYIHNIEYRPQAVICRGQMRTSPTVAYQQIRENIETQFGDRFLVLLQEGANNKPFFALVPNPQALKDRKSQQKLTRPFLALGLLVATLFTTTLIGAELASGNIEAREFNPAVLLSGLPYSLALMTILGIHEMGHYLAARSYKILATLPYFIPVPFFLGTFGAFIQMRSPVPNRKALFDVSIAGPLSGFVATLPIILWGLAHSKVVPMPAGAENLDQNALNPKYSILLALLSKLALGAQLTPDRAIDLHPVALAGLLGLVVTALNLMPVGQLDGGHIVHAMFGQRAGAAIGQIARLLLLGLTFIRIEFLPWVIILFLMPSVDEPALNDVSELDNKRDLWGLLALVLLVLIILPAPSFITQLLRI